MRGSAILVVGAGYVFYYVFFSPDLGNSNVLSFNLPIHSFSCGDQASRLFFFSCPTKISNAHKYENIKKFSIFQAQISLERYFSC